SRCTSAHRALPPFPTRRSSDLPVRRLQPTVQRFGRPRGVRRIAHLGVVVATAFAVLPALTPLQPSPPAQAVTESMTGAATILPVDRKSTRLNSSHVKISYAVFC